MTERSWFPRVLDEMHSAVSDCISMELYVILFAYNVIWTLIYMLSSDRYAIGMWIASLAAQSVVNLVMLAFALSNCTRGLRYLYRAGLILAPFVALLGSTLIWAPVW